MERICSLSVYQTGSDSSRNLLVCFTGCFPSQMWHYQSIYFPGVQLTPQCPHHLWFLTFSLLHNELGVVAIHRVTAGYFLFEHRKRNLNSNQKTFHCCYSPAFSLVFVIFWLFFFFFFFFYFTGASFKQNHNSCMEHIPDEDICLIFLLEQKVPLCANYYILWWRLHIRLGLGDYQVIMVITLE